MQGERNFVRDGMTSLIGRALVGIGYLTLIQIKKAVRLLSPGRLIKLDEWLHELFKRAEKAELPEKSSSRKRTVADETLDNRTYRLESIRCGKEPCKCARGKLYGSYRYSYTRVNDGVTSQYIGEKLPKISRGS